MMRLQKLKKDFNDIKENLPISTSWVEQKHNIASYHKKAKNIMTRAASTCRSFGDMNSNTSAFCSVTFQQSLNKIDKNNRKGNYRSGIVKKEI